MSAAPQSSVALTRSYSGSSGSNGSSVGVDDLAALFAAGHVGAIADGLLQMRDALMRDSPDAVHTCFTDTLPEVLRASRTPFALVLKLLEAPSLMHRPKGTVDLRTLLVRALRNGFTTREHSLDLAEQTDETQEHNTEVQPPPPAELTPQLTSQARDLCLRSLPNGGGPFLSPRTFEAVVSLYRVQLTRRELLDYAHSCFDAKRFRDAAEFLRMQRIEEDDFPHDDLLQQLAVDKGNMDTFVGYLTQSPAFLARHAQHALTCLAERPGDRMAIGGNDPNMAAKLVQRLGLRMRDFPRVRYLKAKEIVWWCCRVGKAAEFGQMLAGDDPGLQRKVLRELSRSRTSSDHALACSFMELPNWRHNLADPEYAAFYDKQKELRLSQVQPPLSDEQRMAANLAASLALRESMLSKGDAVPNLLLPPLPSRSGELPLLFLQPDAIVMVDSMDSLEQARQHLLSEECRAVGVDLEHLPENFAGLDMQPGPLCQLLQIACDSRVFLFDLALLQQQTSEGDAAAADAALPAANAAPSVAAAASSGECFFPPLPPASSARRPPAASSKFVSGVNDLLCSLLFDEDVVKYGIGFSDDLRKLRVDFPHLLCFKLTLHSYADLTMLLRAVEDPDAEARDGHKQRTAQEARKRAAERKKKKAAGKAAARAAAASKPAGLTSLFGGGDEDCEEDEADAAEAAAPSSAADTDDAASALPSDSTVAPVAASASAVAAAAAPVPFASPGVEYRGGGGGGGYTQHGKREGGLAKLCRMVLRRTMDKSEQISNWSKRPLSLPQLQYAALDAYVCVLIARESEQRLGIEIESENIEAVGV